MKKIISLLLAILTICTLAVGMSGCGTNKSDVVGVWKFVGDGNQGTSAFDLDTLHMYIYEDGTGDFYGKNWGMVEIKTFHANSFDWSIDGEYFVLSSGTKYTIDQNVMYDKQGKKKYEKISNDTSVDIEF